ncbi:hypothetical protein COOONC_07752 [Cooperia oncophora]
MGSVAEEDELVEDRFDDQSFEDAPLSDVESNFDEEDLRSVDDNQAQVLYAPQPYCPNSNWNRPALSTIPEESRSDDVATSEKASDILQREEESFMRGHGRFIPDDPRFNQSHFIKENSWEPSIIEESSSEKAEFTCSELPVPPGVENEPPEFAEGCASGDDNAAADGGDLDRHVQFRAATPTEGDIPRETVLTNLTNKPNNEVAPQSLNTIRTTPQRLPAKQLVQLSTNESPNPGSDSTVGVVQTSTPVSMVAKLAARARRLELAENFHGVSMILPEGDSPREGHRALDDPSVGELTNTTVISVGKIQSILRSQPASSSPRTLMKVLEEYKRDRVKARRVCDNTLPPPPQRNPNPQPSFHSREVVRAKPVNNNATMVIHGNSTTVGELTTSRAPEIAEPTASVKPITSQASTAQANNRSSGSAQPNNVSQRPTSVQERGSREEQVNPCLYIPQLEVAFGFVAIGDAAISTVDVTNRTDHSLRLRAKLSHTGPPFALLDSQILVLDARRSTTLRIEFSPTQNARFSTSLLISVEGGGGSQVKYRMPVRGLGGAAVVTVKARDDLRISRNGAYILQSSYESTFSFALTNSGNRRAFSRIIVLYTGENNVPEHVPVDIRPAPGLVIDRGESKQVSVRLRSPLPSLEWRSSQNSLVSTASSTQPRAASQLQVIVYWGEERTRQRLRCYEKMTGATHTCEGIHFTDTFAGEDPDFHPPDDHPISKEDLRLFDQTLRMCTIYVCSPRIRPRPSLLSNSSSLERSLQPDDTFREKSTYRVVIPDQTLR